MPPNSGHLRKKLTDQKRKEKQSSQKSQGQPAQPQEAAPRAKDQVNLTKEELSMCVNSPAVGKRSRRRSVRKCPLPNRGAGISTIQITLFHITSPLKTTSLWLRCLRNMGSMTELGTDSPLKLETEKSVGYLLRSYTYCCLI